MAGAILGDVVRGSDLSSYPSDIAEGIRLHRRVDAATDRHPLIVAARADFPDGARRYAGILLDLANDYVLSRQWQRHSHESLLQFTERAGLAIGAAAEYFERNAARAPTASGFTQLLRSYGSEDGIDRAIARTALRLKHPEKLLQAAADWRQSLDALDAGLPALLDALLQTVLAERAALQA